MFTMNMLPTVLDRYIFCVQRAFRNYLIGHETPSLPLLKCLLMANFSIFITSCPEKLINVSSV